jgi:hypothetical protein
MNKAQYLSGTLDNSTRKIIDSILLENKYFPVAKTDGVLDTPLIIYDGFTYLLDYKLKGKTRTRIEYINTAKRTSENILFLTSLLAREISNNRLNKIDSFSTNTYIDTLKKISSYNLPPPPIKAPSKVDFPKFVTPKPH